MKDVVLYQNKWWLPGIREKKIPENNRSQIAKTSLAKAAEMFVHLVSSRTWK